MIKNIVLAAGLAFAATGMATSSFLLSPKVGADYNCGMPSGGQWCQCFYNFISKTCQEYDGGDICADENQLKNLISQYGAETLCSMAPLPGLSHQQCVEAVNYYLDSDKCPLSN